METNTKKGSASKPEKKLTFEQAMQRLEMIVKKLDSGDAPLDDMLGMFEEGVSLVKLCNNYLDNAEHKITMLVKGENGMEEHPFNSDKNGST